MVVRYGIRDTELAFWIEEGEDKVEGDRDMEIFCGWLEIP